MLVTLREPVVAAVAKVRAQAAARDAIADYQAAFERLDNWARELRADGWDEGAAILQSRAEIADRAARAEMRG